MAVAFEIDMQHNKCPDGSRYAATVAAHSSRFLVWTDHYGRFIKAVNPGKESTSDWDLRLKNAERIYRRFGGVGELHKANRLLDK